MILFDYVLTESKSARDDQLGHLSHDSAQSILNKVKSLYFATTEQPSLPSLPQVSSGRFITALERLGFRRTSRCVVFKKQSQSGEVICAVPLRYPLPSTTILNLLYSAGISREEFLENL